MPLSTQSVKAEGCKSLWFRLEEKQLSGQKKNQRNVSHDPLAVPPFSQKCHSKQVKTYVLICAENFDFCLLGFCSLSFCSPFSLPFYFAIENLSLEESGEGKINGNTENSNRTTFIFVKKEKLQTMNISNYIFPLKKTSDVCC